MLEALAAPPKQQKEQEPVMITPTTIVPRRSATRIHIRALNPELPSLTTIICGCCSGGVWIGGTGGCVT